MDQLRGHTTGYAVPTYVVDAPGGGGKIPVQTDTIVRHDDGVWQLRNWAGKVYSYRDPHAPHAPHAPAAAATAATATAAKSAKAATAAIVEAR
jgi:hypothetical protein